MNINKEKQKLLTVAMEILPHGMLFMPDTYEWFEFKISLIDGNFDEKEQEDLIREWCEYLEEKTPQKEPQEEPEEEPTEEPEGNPEEDPEMKYTSPFGEYEVTVQREKYYNGNLCIQLMCYDKEYDFWEPYGRLTVNFEEKLPEGMAYVDTNNLPNAEEFIEKYHLGEFQDKFKMSGFCCYPLYKFF